MAPDNRHDTRNKQSDQDLFHVKYLLRYDAARAVFGFNKIEGDPCGRLGVALV
jgi:hypothetical protein